LTALDAELLLSQKRHAAPLHKCLDEISKASRRASTLTRQLLAYSRQQVVAPEHLDLNAELREVEKMLDRLLGEQVQLELHPGVEPATVFADRGQIHQMLMNLVINAHDAMPDGGTISLSTEAFTIDDAFARRFHYPVELGDTILLRVKDSGTGIDAADLPRIFEPFFTTKDIGRGTGLGLSTVYGIVKQSGGYIWVDSERGRGTEFQICLPQARGGVAASARVAKPRPASPQGETVLVVDDDGQVLEVLSRLLDKAGYRVVAASTPRAALEAFEETGGLDLVITDLLMGDMDGVELSRRLREKQPELPVLYMSGYDPDAYERRGVMPEKGAFLAKPIDAATLRYQVARMLEGD
ncbi:MAG: ATP-binding protein, partial [Acidobacteriota bacterium]